MYPDGISQMKYDFHTCHSCVLMPQEEIFINDAFTLILCSITSQQDILGMETAELVKTDDMATSFSWTQLTE